MEPSMSRVLNGYSELPSSDTAKRICKFSSPDNNLSLHTSNNDLSVEEKDTAGFLIILNTYRRFV
jgi:hypothetical protein